MVAKFDPSNSALARIQAVFMLSSRNIKPMLSRHGLLFLGAGGSVWALAMLPNGQQLVSGGGGGRLQFWDTRTGTLLQGFTEHEADVLAVAVAPDGDAVFATGIDEGIAMFRRVAPPDGESVSTTVVQCSSLPCRHSHDSHDPF